jgi:hypothetical protein
VREHFGKQNAHRGNTTIWLFKMVSLPFKAFINMVTGGYSWYPSSITVKKINGKK